jgi:ATP-dependent helicase YprA (DUF1998 family)
VSTKANGLDDVLAGINKARGVTPVSSEKMPKAARAASSRSGSTRPSGSEPKASSQNYSVTPLRNDSVTSIDQSPIRPMTEVDSARPLRELRQTQLVQTGVKVPVDLHGMAEDIAHTFRRQIDGRGVGAVYMALLERLRTDTDTREWLEAYLQGDN